MSACSTSDSSASTLGVLEIEADRPATTVQHVGGRRLGVAAHDLAGPVDADDVGAHVGEEHGAERTGPDAGDLEDGDSLEGSHGVRDLPFVWSVIANGQAVAAAVVSSTASRIVDQSASGRL